MQRIGGGLKEMLLYDRERRPPDWVSAMTVVSFAALLRDVQSGEDVDGDGRMLSKGAGKVCLVFESFAEARGYCEERAGMVENLRCEIYDHRGTAEAAVLEVVNPKFAERLGSRGQAGRKMMWAGGLVISGVVMIVLDYWRHLGYLPTVLGINIIALGLRLLHWGYSDLERLRARERRLAEVEGDVRE
jgi:hypothetical protein